ncbi:hypothetical protein IEO21_02754 [Rhodonia placenta]|uniref:Poly [ADP-ribose] polymerase n=1 Tax=Rhodonia placenta TaxID=104341 RepID=A0A8H7P7G6_9APHY|nr:hypothetical protein IEO21_02754 [Postia placenta]
MPPRKKAATATVATDASDASKPPSRATRASTRARAPSSKAQAVDATSTAASTDKPATKAKGKRGRAAAHDSDADEPDAKKVKTDTAPATDASQGVASVSPDASQDAPPAKMVTVLKRGAAPVDPCSGMVDTHQVLVTVDGVWDATLNQTDVGKNANKFYVVQVLHTVGNTENCTLFTRWGRVGENGQQQKKVGRGPFGSSSAVNAFKAQFKAKAGVEWSQRHGMVAKKGKYQWIERVFEDEEETKNDNASSSKKEEEPAKIPDCTLPTEIQILSEVIDQPNGATAQEYGGFLSAVNELTGRYYSIIPHVFGRNRPTVIDSSMLLKRELELVDALGDMEIASKLIASSTPKDDEGRPINPLDANFRSLHLTSMDPVAPGSKEFTALEMYTRDTHGATHQHYQVQVQNAFRVERQEETDAWIKAGHDKVADGDRLLLWHGSRTTNFAGILSQGLRIAPPEGYMFGKGVYFADSANYCHAYLSDNTGIMLLCEVAAKPVLEQQHANYHADVDCKAANKMCTKGLGRTQPAEWQDAGNVLENDALKGCHMPKGPGKDVADANVSLQYNEIRVRYLLMVKMG